MLTVHIGPMILDLTDSLSVCLLINVKFPTSAQRQTLGALIFLGGMEAMCDVFLCLHTSPLGVYVGPYP